MNGYFVRDSNGEFQDEDVVMMEQMKKNESKYDSTEDTKKHIKRVGVLLGKVCNKLTQRAKKHDASKLSKVEKSVFDEYTPKLKDCTYGSDEYAGYLKGLQVALDHHYKHNDHHPEHNSNGVGGMNLFSLMELICDWKAATERHNDGDIVKSLKINKSRFNIDDQLFGILENTVKDMGWSK